MKITQEVRDYAAAQERDSESKAIDIKSVAEYESYAGSENSKLAAEQAQGMAKMSAEFKAKGAELYHETSHKQSDVVLED